MNLQLPVATEQESVPRRRTFTGVSSGKGQVIVRGAQRVGEGLQLLIAADKFTASTFATSRRRRSAG